MTAPDLTKKVLGFRRFTLSKGELGSTGIGNVVWMPGENKARCYKQSGTVAGAYMRMMTPIFPWEQTPQQEAEPATPDLHDAPEHGCDCGLYGLHEPNPLWAHGELLGTGVAAAILAWGRMEVHRDGFRAERAEIVLLAYDPGLGPRRVAKIEKAATAYGVRAVSVDDLEREARQHGERMPEALFPEEAKEIVKPPDPDQQRIAEQKYLRMPPMAGFYTQLARSVPPEEPESKGFFGRRK